MESEEPPCIIGDRVGASIPGISKLSARPPAVTEPDESPGVQLSKTGLSAWRNSSLTTTKWNTKSAYPDEPEISTAGSTHSVTFLRGRENESIRCLRCGARDSLM